MEGVSRDELIRYLGPDFLAYVCATDRAAITSELGGEDVLGPAQKAVLAETLDLASQFSLWRRPNASNDDTPISGPEWEPLVHTFGRFCEIVENGATVANVLRQRAGGVVPEARADPSDALKHAFLTFARDLFPYLLMRPDEHELRWGPSLTSAGASSFNHPAQRAVLLALSDEDEPLSRLFPDTSQETAASLYFSATTGHAGTIQICLLADLLMSNAARRLGWPHRMEVGNFLNAVEAQVDELRALSEGRTVEVPARVGLAYLNVGRGFALDTSLGHLEAADNVAPLAGPGGVAPDASLRITFPLKLTLTGSSLQEGPPPGYSESWQEFARRIDMFRLAVLLALESRTHVVLRVVDREVFDPTAHMGRSWSLVAVPPTRVQLEGDDEKEIGAWAARIKQHFHPSIGLAVRRTLSAADLMRDPHDGLVDAVIALENLFGTGESEVRFRLATALAFLFGETEGERRETHKEVSELYDVRSKIVHGAREPATRAIHELRTRATNVAIRSLRLLFADRPDLIPLEARGKQVILAGHSGSLPSDET